LQVKNGDSSYNETVVVDDQLKFTLNNIPYGNYIASIDEDDLKSANVDVLVKAKPFKVDSALNGKSNIALDFEIKKKQVIGKDTIIAAVPKPIVKVKPNVTKTIYYDEGKKPGLKSDFKNYANGIIAHLKKNPKSRVAIVTHTDDQGTLEEREALTRSIHEKIIKYFVEKGISKQRILVQTKGSLNPAEPNTTAKGRAKNRRIEIKILK
jgi:outer membrane protein OmpA-like peptidoglycan-associated protein